MLNNGETPATAHSHDCNDINYKAISCQEIPDLFLDKLTAKKHFSKFGKINRFILKPKRMSCTIEYSTEEEAERALMSAGNFNGITFRINYAENEVAHIRNTEEWVDPEVRSELEAMGATNYVKEFSGSTSTISNNSNSKTLTIMNKESKAMNSNTLNSSRAVQVVSNNVNSNNTGMTQTIQVDPSIRLELETILRKVALTNEDKYRVLDARDKLIRLTMVKQTDIKKVVATRGTCPDMCPEKERLMREFQRQVSSFEVLEEDTSNTNRISHVRAIKEYSRSSADQEAPLRHELRPEPVLQMTMNYLMHQIMDLCDDPRISLGDWFHFVWDRTRSIRKDITQQELCSIGVVELVEQCARFHIHCAARLVAEESSVFDKKINAENLTKCLQTLKYMYHDLRLSGVHCPNEAEFRSYVILLNLGDSNFIWELRDLPKSIQNSLQIRRAIAFYNALQNNNYVRFFSMIRAKETNYMSGCILLSYFNKLRYRAMQAIIKAHNAYKMTVQLPLTHLTEILAFENIVEAASYMRHLGLRCNVEDDRIQLERIIKPELEFAMNRALNLIESKRTVSVGECICGQSLPPKDLFESHEPHCSFSREGYLRSEAWLAEDQEAYVRKPASTLPPPPPPPPANKTLNSTPIFKENNIFKMPTHVQQSPQQEPIERRESNASHSLFQQQSFSDGGGSSSGGSLFKLSANLFSGNTAATMASGNIFQNAGQRTESTLVEGKQFRPDSIFQQTNQNPNSTVKPGFGCFPAKSKPIFANDATTEKPLLGKEGKWIQLMEHKRRLEDEQNSKLQELEREKRKLKELEERMKAERRLKAEKIREESKRQEERLQSIQFINRAAQYQLNRIVEETIQENIINIFQEELRAYNVQEASHVIATELLEELTHSIIDEVLNEEYAKVCHDHLLLVRYFNRWSTYVRKKKQHREILEQTPLWVPAKTRSQCIERILHPNLDTNMQMIKRYRLGKACNFDNLLACNDGNNDGATPFIDIFELIAQHLSSQYQNGSDVVCNRRMYFKIVISLPADHEELHGFETYCNKWLTKSIERAQLETGPFVHGLKHNVALCVRKLTGMNPRNEQGDLVQQEADHSDGIIYFISGINLQNTTKYRIHQLLKSSQNYKRIPIAIIAYNCSSHCEMDLYRLLELTELTNAGVISEYRCFGAQMNREEFNFHDYLIKAIDFIAGRSYRTNITDIDAIEMQNFGEFFDACLGEEMWHRWLTSSNSNPIFSKICSYPEHVLGIYCKAIDHLIQITQADLMEMPEFPAELKEFVPELNPYNTMPVGLEFFPLDWKQTYRSPQLTDFLMNIRLPEFIETVPGDLDSLQVWLLNYTSICLPGEEMFATQVAHSAISDLYHQLKQPSIQDLEIDQRLSILNYLTIFKPIVYGRIKQIMSNYKELPRHSMIYLRSDLDNYQHQPWWLNYKPLNEVRVDYEAEDIISKMQLNKDQKIQNHEERSLDISRPTNTPHEINNIEKDDDINSIIEHATEVCRSVEKRLTNVKTRSVKDNEKKQQSDLKRSLDDSIHRFEVSRKVGKFETKVKKRKKDQGKVESDKSEMDDIINKAESILKQIERLEDRKRRQRISSP